MESTGRRARRAFTDEYKAEVDEQELPEPVTQVVARALLAAADALKNDDTKTAAGYLEHAAQALHPIEVLLGEPFAAGELIDRHDS